MSKIANTKETTLEANAISFSSNPITIDYEQVKQLHYELENTTTDPAQPQVLATYIYNLADRLREHLKAKARDYVIRPTRAARDIGISVSRKIMRFMSTLFDVIAPILTGTMAPLFQTLKNTLSESVTKIIQMSEYCFKTARASICNIVAISIAGLAIICPSEYLGTLGRILLIAFSTIIGFTHSFIAVGAGIGLLMLLKSMVSKYNINVNVQTHNHIPMAQPQSSSFKEDTKNLVLDIATISVIMTAGFTGLELPSDARSWDSLLKRHSLLHRSFISWEFGADKISEIFDRTAHFVFKYLLGRQYTSFNYISEVENLYLDVLSLCSLEVNQRIGKDMDLSLKIERMYMDYLKLSRIYASNRGISARLQKLGAPLSDFYRRVTDKNPRSHVMRKEPVCIAICGDTGIGKSHMMNRLQQDLLKITGAFDPEHAIENSVYARASEQEFWDGYTGQSIAIYDDFGQRVDSISNPNLEFFEIIRAVNIFSYPLHTAALQDKANTPFTSDFVILTTNLHNWRVESIRSQEAFARRIHLNLKMYIKQEVSANEPVPGRHYALSNLDVAKLREYQLQNNLDEHDMSHLIFQLDDDFFNYDDLITKISLQFKKHHDSFHQRTRNNIQTAPRRLPEGAFSLDSRWANTPQPQNITTATSDTASTSGSEDSGWTTYMEGYFTHDEIVQLGEEAMIPDIDNPDAPPENVYWRHNMVRTPDEQIERYIEDLNAFASLDEESRQRIIETLRFFGVSPNPVQNVEFARSRYRSRILNSPRLINQTDMIFNNFIFRQFLAPIAVMNRTCFNIAMWCYDGLETLREYSSSIFHNFTNWRYWVTAALGISVIGVSAMMYLLPHPLDTKMPKLSFVISALSSLTMPILAIPLGSTVTLTTLSACVMSLPWKYYDIMARHAKEHPKYMPNCSDCTEHKKTLEQLPDAFEILTPDQILEKISKPVPAKEYTATITMPESSMKVLATTTKPTLESPMRPTVTPAKPVLEGDMNRYSSLGSSTDQMFTKFLKDCEDVKCKDCEHGYCLGEEDCPHPEDCKNFNKHLRNYGKQIGKHAHWIKHHVDPDCGHCENEYDYNKHGPFLNTETVNIPESSMKNPAKQQTKPSLEARKIAPHTPLSEMFPESGRALDDKRKKKAIVECAQPEGIFCAQLEPLKVIIRNNFWLLSMQHDNEETFIGLITVIKGKKALINFHYLEIMCNKYKNAVNKDGVTLTFRQPNMAEGHSMGIQAFVSSAKQINRGQNQTEFYLCQLPKTCHAGRDLTKHMITTHEFSQLDRGLQVQLVTCRQTGEHYENFSISGKIESKRITTLPDLTNPTIAHSYLETIYYELPSLPGDCGSPVLIDSNEFSHKIMGFHFAGMKGTGIASPITQSDVKDLLRDEPFLADPVHIAPSDNLDFPLPQSSFYVQGKSTVKISHPCKTSLEESKVHGLFGEPKMLPAVLGAPLTKDGPMLKALMKNASPVKEIEELNILEEVKQDYFKTCIAPFTPTPMEQTVLDFYQACKGIEGNDYFPPIKRGKSAGYPYMASAKKGKEDWFGSTDWDFSSQKCKELRKDVHDMIERAKHGEIPEAVFVATLKDEKRSVEKVLAKKTRVFSACPQHFLIAFRQYFGGFIAFMGRNKIRNESAIGTNAHGRDWGEIVRHLTPWAEQNISAGDFSDFDGTFQPQIMTALVDSINNFYQGTPTDDTIRKSLWAALVNPLHLLDTFIFTFSHGQPSGSPITAISNSMYVSHCLRFILWEKLKSLEISFKNHVKMIAYGDDSLISFSPFLAQHITSFDLAILFKEKLGMKYTTATKGQFTENDPFQTIHDVSFLKRGFSFDPQRYHWYAPLDLVSIEEMCNWIHKCPSHDQATIDNCEGAIQELCHHDYETYSSHSRIITQACKNNGLLVHVPNWEFVRIQMSTGQADYMTKGRPFV